MTTIWHTFQIPLGFLPSRIVVMGTGTEASAPGARKPSCLTVACAEISSSAKAGEPHGGMMKYSLIRASMGCLKGFLAHPAQ